MKKVFNILILLIITISALNGQEKGSGLKKALLLPFNSSADIAEYPSKENISELLFSSFFSYLSIFPFLELPEKDQLIKLTGDNLLQLARQKQADFIVQGEFELSGNPQEPQVVIHIKVWSMASRSFILENSVTTTADLDIFDSIDAIAQDSLLKAFNIESGFGVMRFANFKTGNEKYDLYVNNKFRVTITNQSFSYNLKVLADTPYKVVIKNKHSGVVFNHKISVPSASTTNISYAAHTDLYLGMLIGKIPFSKYELTLDGVPVKTMSIHKGFPAGINHNIIVTPMSSGTPFTNIFYLHEQKKYKYIPYAGHFNHWYQSLELISRGQDTRPDGLSESTGLISIIDPVTGIQTEAQYLLTKHLSISGTIGWLTSYYNVSSTNFSSVNINYLIFPVRIGYSIYPNRLNQNDTSRITLGLEVEPQFVFASYLPQAPAPSNYAFQTSFIQFGAYAQFYYYHGLVITFNMFLPYKSDLQDPNSTHFIRIDNDLSFKTEIGYKFAL